MHSEVGWSDSVMDCTGSGGAPNGGVTPAAGDLPANAVPPCSLPSLNGSWLIDITPPEVTGGIRPGAIRGPMRIESTGTKLRVSGDIYVRRATVGALAEPLLGAAAGFVIDDNWYPALPKEEYRWYFRSAGVSYDAGILSFSFARHLWDATGERFTIRENGSMSLTCSSLPVQPPGAPRSTLQMIGTATIGGQVHTVRAYKTSPFYRGCLVEVDVMANRSWPDVAATCDGQQSLSFTGVYRRAGFDFVATVDRVDVPEDSELTAADMDALLQANRPASIRPDWRLWLLVGSRMLDGTLGIMFDRSIPPLREAAAGMFDAPLPDVEIVEESTRGQALGQAKLAFLRTLVHEAGHAFNLVHPKEDVHEPPVGVTIMNQTGDVMGFSTTANPYPCTALLEFDEHNRTSLIHGPDPQVKPGWKPFGWGHSIFFGGVAEPVDALGLHGAATEDRGVVLSLELPPFAHRGEFVVGTVTLTNRASEPRDVVAALNLAHGDVWLTMATPTGETTTVRDVVRACGPRRLTPLAPGDSRSGQLSMLYTSTGFTFDQPGTYTVYAECVAGLPWAPTLRSAPVQIVIRSAATDEEREIESMVVDHRDGHQVGLAMAFADAGPSPEVLDRIQRVMDNHAETDTGAACALVVTNSLLRAAAPGRGDGAELGPDDGPLAEPRERSDEAAAVEPPAADRALKIAMQDRPLPTVARLCAAVVPPTDRTAPVLQRIADVISATDNPHAAADIPAALRILREQFPSSD